MKKRVVSVFLSLALTLTLAVSSPLAAFADSAASVPAGSAAPEVTLETHPARINKASSYYYDDRLFEGNSLEYDDQLARMSYDLCMMSLPVRLRDKSPDYDAGLYVRTYLTDNGFTDFETNGKYCYENEVKAGDTAVACAHKTINANGRNYTLIAAVPRNATYGGEWFDVFRYSNSADDKGDNAGAVKAGDILLGFLKDYCADKGISGDVKVWMPGYSKGASTVNIAAAKLIRDPSAVFGSGISFDPSDFYCYTFGCPRSAGVSGDYNDDAYACIHNIYDSSDLLSHMPASVMGLDRYGKSYNLSSMFDKNRMLEILKEDYPVTYESFIDPDDFVPLKLDVKALLKGELKFVKDPDSYIPSDAAAYAEAVCESMATVSAKASETGDAREGYYTTYQEPLSRLGNYVVGGVGSGLNVAGIFGGKYGIPMFISMYATYMLDKNQDNINNDVNTVVEGTFNQLSYYIEDGDGNVRSEYRAVSLAYRTFRDRFFTNTETGYVLTKDLKPYRSLILRACKKLTQEFYSRTIRETLVNGGADEAVIQQVAVDDSEAMSYFLTYLFLNNKFQSREIKPFSLDNEQFKQLATLAGALGYFTTYHNMYAPMAGLRAADPLYAETNVHPADSDLAGYRRVYIPASAKSTPLDFSGTVYDESGNLVAEFENDKMISRTDDWIGITSCDNGSWLRLPLDKDYSVAITAGENGTYGFCVSEYANSEGNELRTVSSDAAGSWSSIKASAGDEILLNLPAVSAVDGAYALPSDVNYSLTRPAAKQSSSWTIAKAVSGSNGKLRVTWAGTGNADRYLISVSEKGVSGSTVKKTAAGSTRAYLIKGLKKGKIYKCRVYAQKAYGNSFKTISSSRVVYAIAGNVKGSYTNAKAVKLNKTSVKLKKGKAFKLKATVKKVKSGKKLLSYTSAVRYFSTNKKIATVSSKGVVKAKSAGSCYVYAQAPNGIWKKLAVRVK